MNKEKKKVSVGSFKEAAPIVSWNHSIVEIEPNYDGSSVQITVGLYNKDDDPIEVRGVVFHYIDLPTWQVQLQALGLVRRATQRRYNELHG